MGGLLEVEWEAGGLGTQAATSPELGDSGRDDATRGFKESHDPPPAVMRVALSAGWTGVQWGGVGQMQGPARRPWQRESSWDSGEPGPEHWGKGQGCIWIRAHRQVGCKVSVGEGPADLSPCPLHPASPDAQVKLGDLSSLLSPSPFTSAPPFQPSTAGRSSASPARVRYC